MEKFLTQCIVFLLHAMGIICFFGWCNVLIAQHVCTSQPLYREKFLEICPRLLESGPTYIPLAEEHSQDSAYGEHRGISFISWHRSSIQWEVFREHRLHVRYILVWIYSHTALYICTILFPPFRSRSQVALDEKIDIFPCSLYDKRFYIILRTHQL